MKVEEWKAFSPWFPPMANLAENYVMLDEMQITAQELGDWDRMIDGLMGQATV